MLTGKKYHNKEPIEIQCYLPTVSSHYWKDTIEENVKAVDRMDKGFLWIKEPFRLLFYITDYLAAIVCGVKGSSPHKSKSDRKSELHGVNIFKRRRSSQGKILLPSKQSALWLGEEKLLTLQTEWPLLVLQDEVCSFMCPVIGLQPLLLLAAADRCCLSLYTNIIIDILLCLQSGGISGLLLNFV